jgi:hypothetical protein
MTTTLANQLPRINLVKRRIDTKCPSHDSEIWSNRTRSMVDAKSPKSLGEDPIGTECRLLVSCALELAISEFRNSLHRPLSVRVEAKALKIRTYKSES